MKEQENKNQLNQSKPYKRKNNHKKTEERKELEKEAGIITMKERKKLIKNMSLNAEIQEHYNNSICV